MKTKYRLAVSLTCVLAATLLARPARATTDVVVGLDDGTSLGFPGPVLAHYTYESTKPAGQGYQLRGVEQLPAGTAASTIRLNNQDVSGGVYTGLTGTSNVLREYGIGGGSVTQMRETAAELSDLAIGPDDRLYGYDITAGNLANYAADNGGFTQTALGLGGAGSTSHLEVGSNNKILAMGVDNTDTAFMTTFTFDGATFTEVNSNSSGFRPSSVAISPVTNNIWFTENTKDLPPPTNGAFLVNMFAFEDNIPGCPCPPGDENTVTGGAPLPYAAAIGDLGGVSRDIAVQVEDLQVHPTGPQGFAVGVASKYDVDGGINFPPGEGAWLLGYRGDPQLIWGGDFANGYFASGTMGLIAAQYIGETGTKFNMDIDDEGIIHVLGGGNLQAWTFELFDPTSPLAGFFTAVDVTGGENLGLPTAVAAATGVTVIEDADFDDNGFVDGGDFLIWQRNLPTNGGATNTIGDANADTNVLSSDLAIWENQFGTAQSSSSEVTGVPEPTSSLLAVSGLLLIGSSRRRGSR